MGFLSFLTRKSNDRPGLGIKTQAYESTVAALPPVQGNHSSPQLASTPDPDPDPDPDTSSPPSGTFPVAGNGPNVLDKLQQAARKRSLAQLHLIQPRTATNLTDTAPSPIVPRFPELLAGRPSSAPGPKFNPRPKSVHHSFHLRPANPPVTLRPDNDFIQKQILPPIPVISPQQHRRRRSSLDSTKTRHIDLLDAQGEFRPSNFRSRIEASGAREYGEDVAERNMGSNGCNVHSSASQAFYARSTNGPNPQRPGSKTGPPIAAAQINRDRSRHRQNDTQEAALSLAGASDASAWHPFAGFSQSFDQESPRGRHHDKARDKSREKRPDHHHGNNALFIDQNLSAEDRRKSFHALAASRSKDKPRPRPLSLYDSFSNFNDADLLPPPIPPRSRPRTSGGASASTKIGSIGVESSTEEAYDEPAPSPTIHGPARTMRMMSPIQYQVQNDWLAQSKNTRPEHVYPPLSLSRPSSSSSAGPRSRNHSVGAASAKRLGEITENIPVPMRTSSLGVQSQPCFTPTTMSSGVSSNPFPRPSSQHTQTTSVDMSFLGASDKLGIRHDLGISDLSIDYTSQVYYTAAEDDFSMDIPTVRLDRSKETHHVLPPIDSHAMEPITGFTDDSDVDSFVAVSTQGRESPRGEESLLFDEGIYTGTAGALPGLYDAFAMDARHTAVSRVKAVERGDYGSPKASIRSPRDSSRTRSQLSGHQQWSHKREESHGLTFNEADFSSFLALENDFLRTAGLTGPTEPSHDSRKARRSLYSCEDDDDAKVDMRTAMRLRKDLRRMDTVSSTRSRRSRRELRSRARDDEGNAADNEK